MKRVPVHRSLSLLLQLGWVCLSATPCNIAAANASTDVPQTVPGAGVPALSSDDAVRLALEHSPVLRVAEGRVDAAVGRAAQAGVWSNPELELTAEEWPLNDGRGFADSKQTIGIAQTLPFPGKKRLDRQIGRATAVLSRHELALRETELVRDVRATFYRVLAAERSVEVSGRLVAVASSSAASARKRTEAGATAYQEQLRAEIQLEQARAELTELERARGWARRTLAGLMGRPDLWEAELLGSLADTPTASLLQLASQSWLATHPSALAAQAQVDRAELEHQRARVEPYPDVEMGLAGGRLGETDQSIIELRMAIPLPIFDASRGRKQASLAELQMAEAEREEIRQQLLEAYAKALQRYRAAAAQVAGYRDRLLPKAEEALRLVRLGFDEGKFSFMDLLDTQRTAAEAQLAYQAKLLEMNLAQAELEALITPSVRRIPSAPLFP